MDQNILASTNGSLDATAKSTMQYILVVEVVLCFGAQLFGLCRFSAFFHKLNAFYVAIHFIGTVAVLFFCFQNWEWKLYWNIAILCSGVPFVLEMLTWMLVCWLPAMKR